MGASSFLAGVERLRLGSAFSNPSGTLSSTSFITTHMSKERLASPLYCKSQSRALGPECSVRKRGQSLYFLGEPNTEVVAPIHFPMSP